MLQLTCDFPHCAEHVELLWVQSLDVVIDITVNDNERSERAERHTKEGTMKFALQHLQSR